MAITVQGGLQSFTFRYFIGKNHDVDVGDDDDADDDDDDDDDEARHASASW